MSAYIDAKMLFYVENWTLKTWEVRFCYLAISYKKHTLQYTVYVDIPVRHLYLNAYKLYDRMVVLQPLALLKVKYHTLICDILHPPFLISGKGE